MDDVERKAWLAKRRQGLGGSDIAAILGENPFQSQLDVYLSKIGEVDELEGPAIKRGRALEPIALKLYEEITKRRIRYNPQMIIDPEFPMLFANIDAGVERGSLAAAGEYEDGVLETKAPGLRTFANMKDHGIPKYYYLQIQHYLGVTGLPFGAFAAFSAERWEMLQFDVERDDELIRVMRRVSVEWWTEHVVRRRPPEEQKIEIPVEAAVSVGEVTIIDTPNFRDAVTRYFEARGLSEMAEALVEATKAELLEMMGNHLVVEGGGARFIHKPTKGRTTFDQKALAAVQPIDPIKLRDALIGVDVAEMHPDCETWDAFVAKVSLDLSRFTKTGAASQPFRPYLLTRGVVTE